MVSQKTEDALCNFLSSNKMDLNRPYCDYSMAMTEFAEVLIKLHNHIEKHDLIEDAEDVCNEMKAAVDFLMNPEDFSWFAGNDKAWKAGWNFIRDSIRGWWD